MEDQAQAVNPYEIAAQFIADWWRDRIGHNAIPAYVALTNSVLPDGSEVVIPLGPARGSWAEATVDGFGKGGVIAIVMRDGGKRDNDDGKRNPAVRPKDPEPEIKAKRELVHAR